MFDEQAGSRSDNLFARRRLRLGDFVARASNQKVACATGRERHPDPARTYTDQWEMAASKASRVDRIDAVRIPSPIAIHDAAVGALPERGPPRFNDRIPGMFWVSKVAAGSGMNVAGVRSSRQPRGNPQAWADTWGDLMPVPNDLLDCRAFGDGARRMKFSDAGPEVGRTEADDCSQLREMQ